MSQSSESSSADGLPQRLAAVEEKLKRPKKDCWDKIGSISGLFSGIVVALIGFYATNVYDSRQRAAEDARAERETVAAELQTVEKLLPYLSSEKPSEVQGAIQGIAALGNAKLASKVAAMFGGAGSKMALFEIAKQVGEADRPYVEDALGSLFGYLRQSVAWIPCEGSIINLTYLFERQGITISSVGLGQCIDSTFMGWSYTSQNGVARLWKIELERGINLIPLKIAAPPERGEGLLLVGFSQTAEETTSSWRGLYAVVTTSDERNIAAHHFFEFKNENPTNLVGSPVVNSEGLLVGFVRDVDANSLYIVRPETIFGA